MELSDTMLHIVLSVMICLITVAIVIYLKKQG